MITGSYIGFFVFFVRMFNQNLLLEKNSATLQLPHMKKNTIINNTS